MSEIKTSQGNNGKFEIDIELEDNAGFGLTTGEKLSDVSNSSTPEAETEIVIDTRSDSQAIGSDSTCQS